LASIHVSLEMQQPKDIPRYFAAGCHRMTDKLRNISMILPNMAATILMYEHTKISLDY